MRHDDRADRPRQSAALPDSAGEPSPAAPIAKTDDRYRRLVRRSRRSKLSTIRETQFRGRNTQMRLKIKSLINYFGIFVAVGILVAALIAAAITNQIRIGGALYDKITQGKDLVADISCRRPNMCSKPTSKDNRAEQEQAARRSKTALTQLHKDYDERRAYWQKSDLPGDLVAKLTTTSDKQVRSSGAGRERPCPGARTQRSDRRRSRLSDNRPGLCRASRDHRRGRHQRQRTR